MEPSNETKLFLLNKDLEGLINDEYVLTTRLKMAVKVKNKVGIANLEPQLLTVTLTKDALQEEIATLANLMTTNASEVN